MFALREGGWGESGWGESGLAKAGAGGLACLLLPPSALLGTLPHVSLVCPDNKHVRATSPRGQRLNVAHLLQQ